MMHSSQGFILQEDSYTYYSMGDGVEEAQDTTRQLPRSEALD